VGLGAVTLGSLAIIAAGSLFLGNVVSDAAANAPLPRTDRQIWYIPAARQPVTPAKQLDIARSVPVEANIVPPPADFGIYTHKVGVEALKVRTAAGASAPQAFILKGGTAVAVGATRDGWVEITTEDGRTGWASETLINARS
jgi:hypothetical protein